MKWTGLARRTTRGKHRAGLLGRRAERRAERYLRGNGLRSVARNYRRRSGEIDLVMLHDEVLVFVEVRYRGRGARVSPLDSVDAAKRRRLTRTAPGRLHLGIFGGLCGQAAPAGADFTSQNARNGV